ncbi:hypothetical protein NUSPORA_01289 [Nucleospora cyclopteri]
MFEHKYDESGLPTSYVSLTIIIPLLLIKVYNFSKRDQYFVCFCNKCRENRARKSNHKDLFVIGVLTLIVSVLLKNIFTLKIKNTVEGFNPYQILGIDENTSLKVVKKKYKKLLRPLFQQAKDAELKDGAEKIIMQINKAYDLIKDPLSYQKWILTQTKSELFVAIPQFLLDFAGLSFFLYFLFLALCIPALFYALLYRKRPKTSTKVFYETTEKFFDECEFIKFHSRDAVLQSMLLRLSKTKDLQSHLFKRDLTKDTAVFEEFTEITLKIPLVAKSNEFLHILDVLCRHNLGSVEDSMFIQKQCLNILKAFKEISLHTNTRLFEVLFDLEKMFIQAVPLPKLFALQFPNIGLKSLKEIDCDNFTIPTGFFKEETSSSKELKEAQNVFGSIPAVTISEVQAYNYDENKIQMKDVDDQDVKKINIVDKCFVVDSDKPAFVSFKVTINVDINNEYIHAPYFPTNLKSSNTIYFKLNGCLLEKTIILSENGEKKLKINLPEKKGFQVFDIYFQSNGYFAPIIRNCIKIRFK